MNLSEKSITRYKQLAGLITEGAVPKISLQVAKDNDLFGPVYHGTTEDNKEKINQDGFKVFVDDARTTNVRHGYTNDAYHQGIPAPVHHLGYGIYFTTSKTVATKFNNGTTKGLKVYYLKIPRLETINFGSPRTMMEWWLKNGYNKELATTGNRVKATQLLTDELKSKFDGVWFKGKGIHRLLDGDQVVVFDTSNIFEIDLSLSGDLEIGSTVVLKSNIYSYSFVTDSATGKHEKVFNYDNILVHAGTSGIIIKIEDNEFLKTKFYTIKFKKGGTRFNITSDMIEPKKKS